MSLRREESPIHMKLEITLKDPDGVYDALQEHVTEQVEKIEGLSDQERADLIEERVEELGDKIKTWVQDNEYVTIEIDLKKNTAKVCRV